MVGVVTNKKTKIMAKILKEVFFESLHWFFCDLYMVQRIFVMTMAVLTVSSMVFLWNIWMIMDGGTVFCFKASVCVQGISTVAFLLQLLIRKNRILLYRMR